MLDDCIILPYSLGFFLLYLLLWSLLRPSLSCIVRRGAFASNLKKVHRAASLPKKPLHIRDDASYERESHTRGLFAYNYCYYVLLYMVCRHFECVFSVCPLLGKQPERDSYEWMSYRLDT